ncbi:MULTISPECIES: ABC transporter substrate-binding protein [unclassified Rathayibacter]|uniref:ABC transporter substrate-binding protein n=1 Tax=unclassified Rathayibacter TaxID=2609250 RepID=UPI00188B37C2|nr:MULTISPECIES: ABC transporter substrate-binding protein [unclassified Rathayibacter]MBF4461217.1 ABC transporter substrate-binding protein [Rathayibacter sp. VKM Ac-2879]MBF4502628.1 ABC transporter substrate-binding protein [Rathayibacter sp. VKM Ac-2878]
MIRRTHVRTTKALAALATAALMLTGCASAAAAPAPAQQLRLGYFANVTHAPALIGVQEGLFAKALGDTALSTEVFTAGPAAVEALTAGAIDAAYLGPNPSINTFIQSGGQSARIVSGVTTGGAALVVRDGIDSPADFTGTTLASPQLGNTQDVALRTWLAANGHTADTSGGGDVSVTPTDNAQIATLFQQGRIDGAWVPEPWVSRLVLGGGGHVLVDEADLWPQGAFPTTVLLVRADYLAAHPETVQKLVQGNLDAIAWLGAHPDTAATEINARLQADTGAPLSDEVIARALEHVAFSPDPHAEVFQTLVDHGVQAGVQKKGSVTGLFDLRLLNEQLAVAGSEPVSAGALGEDGR